MLLKAKGVAIGGLFTALAVVSLILSGVIHMSSMYFIALAAFLIGTVMMTTNFAFGISAGTATLLLGLMLVPRKTHCLTFSICAAYVLAEEFFLEKKRAGKRVNPVYEWCVKVGAFVIPVILELAIECCLFGWNAMLQGLLLPEFLSDVNVALKIAAVVVMIALYIAVIDRVYIYYSWYVRRMLKRMMN